MTTLRDDIYRGCQRQVTELPRRSERELHFVVADSNDLLRVGQLLARRGAQLCTMVANDERFLEDHAFKIYYVFSMREGEFVILEYALRNLSQYVSIRDSFRATEAIEHEIGDLFGLTPTNKAVAAHYLLNDTYPESFHPLRPRRTLEQLKEAIKKARSGRQPLLKEPAALAAGMTMQTVGPIHGAIIEAGQFIFEGAGELIEQLTIRPGYKHRGIEKLFETGYTLESGWQLAECVVGDSSFSHALAYCQAVEALAGIEPPEPAHYWRGLFLELERLYNHIADTNALIHDIALDLIDAEMAVLRERAMRLNKSLAGHRLLRGVNRVGGVVVPPETDLPAAQREVRDLATQFLDLGAIVLKMQSCRARLVGIGVLSDQEAQRAGATGLMARASGLAGHDFRLRHPHGAFALCPELRAEIVATVTPDDRRPSTTGRRAPIFQRDLRGDVFARLALRIAEVETSARISDLLLGRIGRLADSTCCMLPEPEVLQLLRQTPNSEFGLGYVEGWRGDICYWVMKGAGNTIRRCKVRDPSVFNWLAFRLAVIPKVNTSGRLIQGNILPDFPLINRSCGLSFAGSDG